MKNDVYINALYEALDQQALSCRSIVIKAIQSLENNPCTNAGLGSQLTLTGEVELDASIMDGSQKSAFGAVSGLKCCRNAISAAAAVLTKRQDGLSHKRVPPMMLAGSGASVWLKEHAPELLTKNPDLITEERQEEWREYRGFLDKPSKRRKRSKDPNDEEHSSSEKDTLLDTVGAVCMDQDGSGAAGASSGGLSMKYPGRVGQGAIFGAGCWAENAKRPQRPGVVCSVTGEGEFIMTEQVASKVAEVVRSRAATQSVGPKGASAPSHPEVLEVAQDLDISEREFGILALVSRPHTGKIELQFCHSSRSFALGYHIEDTEKAWISRRPENVTIVASRLSFRGQNIDSKEQWFLMQDGQVEYR